MSEPLGNADSVTDAGVYELPEDLYHADPVPEGSLSVSGAKKLLPPSCPAIYRWEREHGRPHKPAFSFGHAAHKLVLGVGADLVEVEADDWRTNAAKAIRDEALERGAVPLLSKDMRTVEAMAMALHQHPIAAALLRADAGVPEASLFWRDDKTGVMRRGRLDWLPNARPDGRLIIPDYKTADSAEPGAFARSAAKYGYHMQAPWYLDGVEALNLAEDAAFVFIVQEKTAPYLVSVVELDSLALRIGRERNRQAIDTYLECRTTDTWPGYADDVTLVSLPRWAEYDYEQETA
jgi:hypothetical protein